MRPKQAQMKALQELARQDCSFFASLRYFEISIQRKNGKIDGMSHKKI
jgi:hypothetical protein